MNKMSKTEVYSWRLSTELKTQLEAAARDEKTSVGAILERVVREWLASAAQAERRGGRRAATPAARASC